MTAPAPVVAPLATAVTAAPAASSPVYQVTGITKKIDKIPKPRKETGTVHGGVFSVHLYACYLDNKQ